MMRRSKTGRTMRMMTRYDDEEQEEDHNEDEDEENEQRMRMRKKVWADVSRWMSL